MVKTIYNNLIISYNRYNEMKNAKTALSELYRRLNIGSIVESDESDGGIESEEQMEEEEEEEEEEEQQQKEENNKPIESPKKKRKIVNIIENESEENSINSMEEETTSAPRYSFDKNWVNELLKQHSIDSAEILQNKLYPFFIVKIIQ